MALAQGKFGVSSPLTLTLSKDLIACFEIFSCFEVHKISRGPRCCCKCPLAWSPLRFTVLAMQKKAWAIFCEPSRLVFVCFCFFFNSAALSFLEIHLVVSSVTVSLEVLHSSYTTAVFSLIKY